MTIFTEVDPRAPTATIPLDLTKEVAAVVVAVVAAVIINRTIMEATDRGPGHHGIRITILIY